MNRFALLSGPSPQFGAESYPDHTARLGPLPPAAGPLIAELERADLRGRGGAGFPVATKWRAVASHTAAARLAGRGVVLVNGAEGEPLSQKDRVLMASRPHLIIDGAVLAARTVGANRIILYVGTDHTASRSALVDALRERGHSDRIDISIATAPARYVAGEESAAVHCINDGVALPTSVPPRPYERGVGGRPTLVQNVETLAHAALIARFGGRWFADLGHNGSTGTILLTLSGQVRSAGVIEVAGGTPLSTVLGEHALAAPASAAVLLGGYFGGWIGCHATTELALDSARLRSAGHALGCGVVHVGRQSDCGVVQTARMVGYLSAQSARQCGPCVFGLRAIADALDRVADREGNPDDLVRVRAWSGELGGRGGCRHPDGAANLVRSALHVFAEEFTLHAHNRRCSVPAPLQRVA